MNKGRSQFELDAYKMGFGSVQCQGGYGFRNACTTTQ